MKDTLFSFGVGFFGGLVYLLSAFFVPAYIADPESVKNFLLIVGRIIH